MTLLIPLISLFFRRFRLHEVGKSVFMQSQATSSRSEDLCPKWGLGNFCGCPHSHQSGQKSLSVSLWSLSTACCSCNRCKKMQKVNRRWKSDWLGRDLQSLQTPVNAGVCAQPLRTFSSSPIPAKSDSTCGSTVFSPGHPRQYSLAPAMLNFADRTRRGVFIAVWPQITEKCV